MLIIKVFLWLILVPFILGKSILKKDENKVLYSWVLGTIVQMAIFWIIALPMILAKVSFFTLWKVYMIAIILLFIATLIIFRRKIFIKPQFEQISFFQIVAIVLIFVQLFVKFKYTNVNNDDAAFIASATKIKYDGYMYYTEEWQDLDSRKALAPISAYYAAISQIVGADVAVLAHTIMPVILISISYIIYYYLGRKVFENKDSSYIMLIILSFLNLYAFSIKGPARYLILYPWFGRSILAGICLPLIWNISLEAMNKEENSLFNWITLFLTIIASCLCSEMAVPLVTISLMGLTIVSTIRDKKPIYILKSALSILPCLMVGIIYILMNKG